MWKGEWNEEGKIQHNDREIESMMRALSTSTRNCNLNKQCNKLRTTTVTQH